MTASHSPTGTSDSQTREYVDFMLYIIVIVCYAFAQVTHTDCPTGINGVETETGFCASRSILA